MDMVAQSVMMMKLVETVEVGLTVREIAVVEVGVVFEPPQAPSFPETGMGPVLLR